MLLYSRYWREYLPFWHPIEVVNCADPRAASERMAAKVGSCILAKWSKTGWKCVR
jgi:hypothetical protein